jgi:excisionase family DNA binding protein
VSDGPRHLHLLLVAEVAERLRTSKTWVYDAIRSGDLPAVKLGRCVKVLEQDLAQYLEAHRVRVESPPIEWMDPDEMVAEARRTA